MTVTLLIDVGSTNTKITAVDLDKEEVVGRSYASSTVATDMSVGLKNAYDKLLEQMGVSQLEVDRKLACSSAAGGLRMVAVGLVPLLTTEAAKRAAFGAGARLVGTYSYQLNLAEIKKIEQSHPDIILLAGGTDGGNTEVVLHNAKMMANSGLVCPIVMAGNKAAADEVKSILEASGKPVQVTSNVLPELDRLDVEPCRGVIREIFINRIVHGKGLDKAEAFLGGIIMPTPLAVLNGARLLAQGTPDESGIGDLAVVDIGGATTNVISICEGSPSQPCVIQKGLPEPYAKRTVEGDLGIRYNAPSILEQAGGRQVLENMKVWDVALCEPDLEEIVNYLSTHVAKIPKTKEEFLVDIGLARTATHIAMSRHTGVIEVMYTPTGQAYVQWGKDLSGVKLVIGTGGVFAYGREPEWILEAVRGGENSGLSLMPKNPDFLIDKDYILYAVGLLAELFPEEALRIAKRSLRKAVC